MKLFYGLFLLRLQLLNTRVKFFLSLLPDLWNILFLISMSWQRRYRINVCVCMRSFFFFEIKKKWSWSSTQTITRWTCSPPADKQWAIHLLPRVWWWSASFHSYIKKREKHKKLVCASGRLSGKDKQLLFPQLIYFFLYLFNLPSLMLVCLKED